MKTLPDSIRAIRRLTYDGGSLAEAFDDDQQTLENVIDLALDYAVEDLNNSTTYFSLEAEWLDDNGEVIKVEEYDGAGNFVRAHGVLATTPEFRQKELTFHPYSATPIRLNAEVELDDEIAVSYGTEYVDPDVDYAYICAVANNIKTLHVVVVNGSDRPVFKVLDDEGISIEPSYPNLNLAIAVAKGWLS